MLNVLSINDLR